MAIQKMTLVNLNGPLDRLDDAILACSDMGCFHPKDITPAGNISTSFEELQYKNPYSELLGELSTLASQAGITLRYKNVTDVTLDREAVAEFTNGLYNEYLSLSEQLSALKSEADSHKNALVYLKHLQVLNLRFDKIFGSQYLKVRFGRLPRDSEKKLMFYQSKLYLFFPFDTDESYIWGVYFTTNEYSHEIDDIFSSLFFERVRVPDYVHDTPQLAIDDLNNLYNEEQKKIKELDGKLRELITKNSEQLNTYFSQIKFLHSTFELRQFVGSSGGKFYMVGFIPKSDENRFRDKIDSVPEVTLDLLPEDTDKRFASPTKLKNGWFSQPFEMFVKMYGMPSHNDMDPTPYVAVVYTLLFGIMFGDLGQGLLLSLFGFLAYRLKKMELGRIITRIGFSSAIFGVLYGSVFGFEEALDPFWEGLGFAGGAPIKVMHPETITQILIFAVALGAVIITISIAINIIVAAAHREYPRMLFSQNGLAGLVLYLTILIGAVLTMGGRQFFTPLAIILGIVLPIVVIFFREPLTHLLEGKRKNFFPDGVGSFIAESFFELFEVALSFLANTMSFLRVGGFILSHAGMMAVVFTISHMMSSGTASILVIVIGNLFVMCLEGLIVGIQVLRLQFYEMFSRFFIGEGEPFEPISVDFQTEE